MKKISRIVIAVLVLLINFSCTRAQDGMQKFRNSTPEQRAAYQTKLMKDNLDLTQGQVAKVQAINLKYAQKFQAIIKSSGSKKSKIKSALPLFDQKDKELQAVFTKDQFSKYQEYEQKIKSKLSSRMKS